MKPHRCFVILASVAVVFSLSAPNPAWAQAYSHARIVRLSYAEGDVTIARPDVQEWAQAPVNTPLQEGFKLSTGESSFAEVQFENGSTIRFGQLALLDFTQLALTAGGGKINHVQLEQGYATFHAQLDNGEDSYEVVTPSGTLTPRNNALFRVDLDRGAERLEVFKGTLDVASNLGAWTLEKNSVLELQPGASQPATLSQGINKDDWDRWVEDRENRMETAQTGPLPSNYTGNTGNSLYGWSDLGEYGNWTYLAGWGYGWIPAGMGYGWAPYSAGRWCWYPGWGYTWISTEPWGWLPYHCGTWEFVEGVGWVWFPEACEMWSPALVTWYTGPGWIGWIPRPQPVPGRPPANPGAPGLTLHPGPPPVHGRLTSNVGGAVVSTNTFRNGGVVNSISLLDVNPSTGQKIDGPGVQPTVAMMLPGLPVPQPAAQPPARAITLGNGLRPAPGFASAPGKTLLVEGGHEVPAGGAAAPAMPGRRVGVTPPDSEIVYDPQADRFENNPSVTPEVKPSVPQKGLSVTAAPEAKPGLAEPLQGGKPEGGVHAAEAPASLHPSPMGGAPAATTPARGFATSQVESSPRGAVGGHAPSASHSSPSFTPAEAEPSKSEPPKSVDVHPGGGTEGGGGHAGGTTASKPPH